MTTTPGRDYESSLKGFLAMPQSEWLGLIGSLLSGGILEPEEQRAFKDACEQRAKIREEAERAALRTEACKQGLHNLCDGEGVTVEGAAVPCACHCHRSVVST